MQIQIDIPEDRIADLMTAFIEGGDPVTSASKGGWCVSVANASRKAFTGDWWYADPKYFTGSFKFVVVELDEAVGRQTKHTVTLADIRRGMTVMAKAFPYCFANVLQDHIDAPCADIFMQCCLFGEEKYA